MSWGRAILAAAIPALLVGPLSGMLGGVVMVAVFAIALGGSEPMAYPSIIIMMFGALVGLIVSFPACLVLGAILAKAAIRDAQWLPVKSWLAAGAAAGACIGGLVVLLFSELASTEPAMMLIFTMVFATATGLGAFSAWLMWRILRGRVARLNTVDSSVFE